MSKIYLVVNHIYRPANGVKTHRKDWHKLDNSWDVEDQVTIVDGTLKKNVLAQASVVIDLSHNSVLKNRNGTDDLAVRDYYLKAYQEEVKRALMIWSLKDPRNLTILKDMSNGNESDTN